MRLPSKERQTDSSQYLQRKPENRGMVPSMCLKKINANYRILNPGIISFENKCTFRKTKFEFATSKLY